MDENLRSTDKYLLSESGLVLIRERICSSAEQILSIKNAIPNLPKSINGSVRDYSPASLFHSASLHSIPCGAT